MALDKTTVEVPFVKGQNQKPRPEVVEMDIPYVLRNVRLNKTSGYTKRHGQAALSTSVIGPGDLLPTFGGIGRLAVRDNELVAICANSGAWGSAGGAGAAGDTVFSYSSALSGWKPFGKIGRPTSDVLHSAPPVDNTLRGVDSAATNGRLMTVVKRDTGIHATVFDLSTNTRIVNNERVIASLLMPMAFGMGTRLYVFGYDDVTDELIGFVYDTEDHDSGFAPPVVIASVGSTTSNRGFDVTSDGASLYLTYHWISGGAAEIRVIRVTNVLGAGTAAQTVRAGLSSGGGHNAIHCTAGAISIAYSILDSGTGLQRVETKRVTNNATLSLSSGETLETDADLLTGDSAVRVATFNSEKHFVFWDSVYDSSTETGGLDGSGTPPKVLWATIEGTQASPLIASTVHSAVNLKLYSEPFVISQRLYLPILGTRHVPPGTGPGAMGYYKGVYLCEVDPVASTNATASLMPIATNFLDITSFWCGRKTSVEDSKAYVTVSRRQHNPFDEGGQIYYVEYPIISTIVYDFADRYRWQPADHNQDVLFSGALPYLFDGQNVHECGFVWRPEIMGVGISTGGALVAGQDYTYRVTYEARDNRGNRWHSQVSYAVEGQVTPTGGNLTANICVSSLSLSMWGDASVYFPCRIYIVLWRALPAGVAAGEYVRVREQEIFPYTQNNIVIADGLPDADVDSAERLYVFGNELENFTAPPCRVLFQHRDRLIAYNTETKTIWYTKPMMAERGIEWSLAQQIPVAEDIIAGASLEHAAILFSRTKTYALDGDGPGPTGTPADAFARLTLLNADIGCSEDCAAWRSPAGVFFRADNGIWLVSRSMEFQYLGAPIEDEEPYVSYTTGGIVDTAGACFRLYYYRVPFIEEGVSRTHCFVYWYDSARWSMDDYESNPPVSAVAWQGAPYWADDALVRVATPNSYADGLDTFYPMGVTLGWARFADLHAFKRIWRFLLTLKMFSGSRLLVSLAKNYDPSVVQQREYSAADVGTAPGQIRLHLKHQKLASVRVTLEELQEDPELSNVVGFELFGVGFELGVKRGAVKLGADRTAAATE